MIQFTTTKQECKVKTGGIYIYEQGKFMEKLY